MSIAKLNEVTVRRAGRTLLGPVSVRLGAGEFVGVLGPNGSGKSTLLRLLVGLIRPSLGRVEVGGQDLWATGGARGRERLRAGLGYLPQRHEMANDVPFTVAEVVGFGCAGQATGPAACEDRVRLAMAAVGLGDFGARLYRELSGGEQQRVQLARIWAREAPLILLDEPTAGLDPEYRERLTDLTAQLHASGGRTVVMVTHDLAALPATCQRLLLLRGGRMVGDGLFADMIREERLSETYACPMVVVRQGGRCHAWPREGAGGA